MTLYFNDSNEGIDIINYNRSANVESEDVITKNIVIATGLDVDLFAIFDAYNESITSIVIIGSNDEKVYELKNVNYIITSVNEDVRDDIMQKYIYLNLKT